MKQKPLITGMWKKIHLVCGNHSEGKYLPMELNSTTQGIAYCCPNDKNVVSTYEYEKMLTHISDMLLAAEENNEYLNLKNYQWTRNEYHFRVLEHTPEQILISVTNRKIMDQN